MPIINSMITSGIQPSGTKSIVANGTYDVIDYASADVQVPTTAPDMYVSYSLSSTGVASKGETHLAFDRVTDVTQGCFKEAFTGSSAISGVLDLGSLVGISGSNGFYSSFQNCPNITGVSIGSLATITGSYGAYSMFKGCNYITGTIDLGSLTSISGSYGCQYMFDNCTRITGVDLSALTSISNSACKNMFHNCTNITSVNLGSLTTVSGSESCMDMFSGCTSIIGNIDLGSLTTATGSASIGKMFQNCTGITSVDLSSLVSVSGSWVCQYMFDGCIGITSADLSSLTTVSGTNACQYMFRGCTSLSSVDLSSITSITGSHACEFMFYNCTGLTGHIDLSNLTTAGSDYACNKIFQGCTGITSIDISGLKSITGGYNINEIVKDCTSLVSIDLSSLVYIGSGSWCAGTICEYCSSLTTVKLDSLSTLIGYGAMERAFGYCTNLKTLSFPALKQIDSNYAFRDLIKNTTDCTIHFPKNLDPETGSTVISSLTTYPYFSGTNTVLLFDLPSTNVLTGLDDNTYSRNPKYDTQTALAWKAGNYNSLNLIPAYYTNGITDPEVGDTIYSDSACTTAVTTIDSIA